MELLFLGTSAGWPLPRLGCNCNICSSSDPRDKRLRPSLLVNDRILLDAPFDIYHELTRCNIDPRAITHILITHSHDDHIWGLYDLSHIYNKNQKLKLVSTRSVLSQIRNKLNITMLSFEINEVKPFEKFPLDSDTHVWFLPVEHTIDAYALKLKAPKPFCYAPEFRKIKISVRKKLGDVDLAILDGSSKDKRGQAKGHETIVEGLRLGKEINAKRTLFTNIGHKTDTHENLEKFVKSPDVNRDSPRFDRGRFGIAFDGMKIKL